MVQKLIYSFSNFIVSHPKKSPVNPPYTAASPPFTKTNVVLAQLSASYVNDDCLFIQASTYLTSDLINLHLSGESLYVCFGC